MNIQTFCFPTSVRFGVGARHEIIEALVDAALERPLLVIDPGIEQLPPFLSLVERISERAEARPFSDFSSQPDLGAVARGQKAFSEHRADAIVGIGGGVALDMAKAIALLANNPGAWLDYEDGRPDARPVTQPIPWLGAVPTTAGTGSEVGRSAVISGADGVKHVIFAPELMPKRVFADPELLCGLPPGVTAATGMDALTHCVEAFLAPGFQPLCDGIALRGVTLVARSLKRCVERGDDLEARADLMAAALMGATAFQKGLGVNHSCAHALGTVCGLHHGLANGALLPYAMRFNLAASPERFEELARAAELEAASGEAFIAWLVALNAELGIPARLRELGVVNTQLDALVSVALADGCHATNPRPCDAAGIRSIFEAAL
jgi:alcohol dehydrogenase class IV